MELEYGVGAGIKLKTTAAGMVPIYEEHAARLERRISLDDWYCMDVYERALVVAHRRIHIQVQNLQSEAEIRNSKREAKKSLHKGK